MWLVLAMKEDARWRRLPAYCPAVNAAVELLLLLCEPNQSALVASSERISR